MTAAYVESDIDQFIRSQKAKLQQERNIIGGPQGKGGRGSGRKSWDKPQDNRYASQRPGGQAPRRAPPSRDRRRAPREAARRSDVKVNVQREDERPRLRHKEATPPYDGMKFGDFEEYRKRIEDQRKQEYKHDLEKQVEEKKRVQAEQKHKENVELASRHPYVPIDNDLRRMQREEQRRKAYDRRLAEQNRKHDGVALDLSPRSRSQSPVDPQYESYVEERLRREAEIRRQEEEAFREAEARRAYDEQLTERELQRQQDLLQRQRLDSLEDEVRDNYRTPRGDPYRPPGLMPEERSKEFQRLTELLPNEEVRKQGEKEVFIEGQEKYDGKIKSLQDERNREYNQLIAKQKPPKTSKPDTDKNEGGALLKLGGYENKRKQLDEERHQEYLRFQQAQQSKKRDKRGSRSPVAPNRKPPSADSDNNVSDYVLKKVYETEMRHINEEKRELDEYLDHKRKVHQQADRKHQDDASRRGGKQTPDMISKLGGYQKERVKLEEERKKDYNRLLAETTAPPRAAPKTEKEEEQFGASLPGLRSHESAEKHAGRQHITRPITEPVAGSAKRGGKKEYATLPGLNYSESAEKRKVEERNREYNELLHEKEEQEDLRKRKIELRNREYNEYKHQKEKEQLTRREADLRQRAYEEYIRERDYWYNWRRGNYDNRPGGPRKGWQTPPSYEEILDKKRREEAQYRRLNSPRDGDMPSRLDMNSSQRSYMPPRPPKYLTPLPQTPDVSRRSNPRVWRHEDLKIEPPPPPALPRIPSHGYRNKSWEEQQLRSRDIQRNVEAWKVQDDFTPNPWQRDRLYNTNTYNAAFR